MDNDDDDWLTFEEFSAFAQKMADHHEDVPPSTSASEVEAAEPEGLVSWTIEQVADHVKTLGKAFGQVAALGNRLFSSWCSQSCPVPAP